MDQLDDDDEFNEHHNISDSHNIPGILEEQFALADVKMHPWCIYW